MIWEAISAAPYITGKAGITRTVSMLSRESEWPTGVTIVKVSPGLVSSAVRFQVSTRLCSSRRQQQISRKPLAGACPSGARGRGLGCSRCCHPLLGALAFFQAPLNFQVFCSAFIEIGNSCRGVSRGKNNSRLLLKAYPWLVSFRHKCRRSLH